MAGASTPNRYPGLFAAFPSNEWTEERESESESEDEFDEETPTLAWQGLFPTANGIPPSPQLDPHSERLFWQGSNPRSSRPSLLRLPFDLGSGNVFWGFHRKRRRPGLSRYGSIETSPSRFFSTPGTQGRGQTNVLHHVGYRNQLRTSLADSIESLHMPPTPVVGPRRNVFVHAFRPTTTAIDNLLSSWPRRIFVLICIPVMLVLCWCGVPFPTGEQGSSPIPNANFWFFLFWYFGCYVAVALIFITQLFTLYRLNWWPKAIGAKWSYTFFWTLSLTCGYLMYQFDVSGSSAHSKIPDEDERQWELKTEWVLLTFATMAMPAFICFIGLRRSGRQRYQHSVSYTQQTFSTRDTMWRIPASYKRFLWFITSLGISLVTLLAGQVYAIVFMSTLPHTSMEGTAYVTFWMITVHILGAIVQWIMTEKVRSRSLLYAFKYYYFMVYFIFYRNLFARLRSFDQFALVQLLSSMWICIWYPITMSRPFLRILNHFNSRPSSYEMHVEKVSMYFYLRNTAQHTTMLAFLGWLSILHFGINQPLYPLFSFDDKDPYNYRLTMFGSLAIWASEIASNLLATTVRLLLN